VTLVKIGTGSRILPPEGPFRTSFGGIYLPRSRHLLKVWQVCRQWAPPRCKKVQIRFLRKSNLAGGGGMYRTYNMLGVTFNCVNYTVSQKTSRVLPVITLSNLNRFSKLFHIQHCAVYPLYFVPYAGHLYSQHLSTTTYHVNSCVRPSVLPWPGKQPWRTAE